MKWLLLLLLLLVAGLAGCGDLDSEIGSGAYASTIRDTGVNGYHCSLQPEKWYLCHTPQNGSCKKDPSLPECAPETICVSPGAAKHHYDHGDTLGECIPP